MTEVCANVDVSAGLRDGMLIPDDDKQSLEDILQVAFEAVSTEQLQQAIATRSSRMYD